MSNKIIYCSEAEEGYKRQLLFFLMIRRPPRSTPLYSSAASDVYKRQVPHPPDRLGFVTNQKLDVRVDYVHL